MDNLNSFISNSYGTGSIIKVDRVLRGYSNENFIVNCKDNHYFLRGYRFDDPRKIEELHTIESFFSNKGIPLPLPIPDLQGKAYVIKGQKIYSLFPFVDGIHISAFSLINDKRSLRSYAQVLSKIHLADKEGYPQVSGKASAWNPVVFREKYEAILSLINVKNDLDDFDQLTLKSLRLKKDWVEKNKNAFEDFGLPCDHLIHGDYYLDNVLFNKEGQVISVLDWEKSDMAPRSLELARSVFFTFFFDQSPSQKTLEAAAEYLHLYSMIYPIKPEEAYTGLKVQFLKFMHDLWLEENHYLKNISRTDNLMAQRTAGLLFVANDLENNLNKLIVKLC